VDAGDVGVVVYGVVGAMYGVVGIGMFRVRLVYDMFGDLEARVGDDGNEDPKPNYRQRRSPRASCRCFSGR
jgi:hypothetical protein